MKRNRDALLELEKRLIEAHRRTPAAEPGADWDAALLRSLRRIPAGEAHSGQGFGWAAVLDSLPRYPAWVAGCADAGAGLYAWFFLPGIDAEVFQAFLRDPSWIVEILIGA